MVRKSRCIVVFKMARNAVCRGPLENIIHMTVGALQQGMRPVENKAGERSMIEKGKPSVHAVAHFALERKFRGHMIDRFRVHVVRVMAEVTIGTQPSKQPYRGAGVAAFASDRRMGAHQRKTVRMQRIACSDMFPAPDAVALGTVGSHLASVDIGMAVRTG